MIGQDFHKSVILTNLKCNIVNVEVWTHNTPVVAIMHVTDEEIIFVITNPNRLFIIKELKCNVLGGGNKNRGAKIIVTNEVTLMTTVQRQNFRPRR